MLLPVGQVGVLQGSSAVIGVWECVGIGEWQATFENTMSTDEVKMCYISADRVQT